MNWIGMFWLWRKGYASMREVLETEPLRSLLEAERAGNA